MLKPSTRTSKILLGVIVVFFFGLLGWILSTNPPPPVVFVVVLIYTVPMLGIARSIGYREGIEYVNGPTRVAKPMDPPHPW